MDITLNFKNGSNNVATRRFKPNQFPKIDKLIKMSEILARGIQLFSQGSEDMLLIHINMTNLCNPLYKGGEHSKKFSFRLTQKGTDFMKDLESCCYQVLDEFDKARKAEIEEVKMILAELEGE